MTNLKLVKSVLSSFFRIRLTEMRIAEEYASQLIRCPTHLSLGQELLPAILSTLMTPQDFAVSTHRCHAHYLAKGGNLRSMILELYGCAEGCAKGRGGSMHLVDTKVGFMGSTAIVGNSIPVGTGLAYTFRLRGIASSLSFVFLGDGATEEGVFSESINLASVLNLPVVFICENNEYSVYTSREFRQPRNRKIHEWVAAFGINSARVEMLSIDKSIKELKTLVQQARLEQKPLFIEVPSWRSVEHCGPNSDDHLNYRDPVQIEYWQQVNHEFRLIQYALDCGVKNSEIEELRQNIHRELDEVFSYAKSIARIKREPDFEELYAR